MANKISVVLASYNSSNYINEQLDSILCQLSDNDELIIGDDCSTDSTIDIIKEYRTKYKNIVLVQNKTNVGINKNFENLLSKVNGDIVFFSDADDVWHKDKIKIMSELLMSNKKIKLVMHNGLFCDEHLNSMGYTYFDKRKCRPGLLKNLYRNCFCGCMCAFKSELLKHILPFPKKMPFFYDEWVGLVAEKYGKTAITNQIFIDWRRHGKNASWSNPQNNKIINKITHFFKYIYNRLRRVILIIAR